MFIKMVPICGCGYIFTELSIKPIQVELFAPHCTSGYVTSPSICPKCGEFIEGVKYQPSIDGTVDYNEERYKD